MSITMSKKSNLFSGGIKNGGDPLRKALRKANKAVERDKANDIKGALKAYREACGLLEGYFDDADKDQYSLRQIYISYTDRIDMLSNQLGAALTSRRPLHHPGSSSFDDIQSTHSTEAAASRSFGGLTSMFSRKAGHQHSDTRVRPTPKPSHSTPIHSGSKPARGWLPSSGARKKRNSSDCAEQHQLPPPLLPTFPTKTLSEDDYFDLRSTSVSSLLHPSSRYSLMKKEDDPGPEKQYPAVYRQDKKNETEEAMAYLALVLDESAQVFEEKDRPKRSSPLPHDRFSVFWRSPTKSSRLRSRSSSNPSIVSRPPSTSQLSDQGEGDVPTAAIAPDKGAGGYGYFAVPAASSGNKDNTSSLVGRMHRSMVDGAYITDSLYVPKQVWSQSNIRLPALDAKLAAWELLLAGLERMTTTMAHKGGPSLKDVRVLEQSLEQIRDGLGCRLLQQIQIQDKSTDRHIPPIISSSSSNVGTTAKGSLSAWSSKLSKSVERMKRVDSSRILDPQYIQTLIQLLCAVQMLEHILHKKWTANRNTDLVPKLQAIMETMDDVIGRIVLQDLAILLDKWTKCGRQWILD